MIESKIYIGLNDVNTNTQLFENEKYIKGIRNVCYSHRVPFSFHVQEGGYFYENGEEELSEDEAIIYNSLNRLGKSSSQIAKTVGFGKNKTLKLLVALEEKGYVTKLGNGRGIKYLIKS